MIRLFITTLLIVVAFFFGIALMHGIIVGSGELASSLMPKVKDFALEKYKNIEVLAAERGMVSDLSYTSKDDEEYKTLHSALALVNTSSSEVLSEKLGVQHAEYLDESKIAIINLQSKKVEIFNEGVIAGSFEILSTGSIGKDVSIETGNYDVLYKNDRHFSPLAKTYFPNAVQFFGNAFIHGPLNEGENGALQNGRVLGSITLSEEDSLDFFDFSEVDMPVEFISESLVPSSQGLYSIRRGYSAPSTISATSYLVADLETGDVLLKKNSADKKPIASITKLMTALTSVEVLDQFQRARVSKYAVDTYGTSGNLSVGQYIVMKDLLYPLLLESSNDASEVLAEHYDRESFLAEMNAKAKAVGLEQTYFADPSGLSENNVSTAEDLYRLVRYIHQWKRYILDITMLPTHQIRTRQWNNNNVFVDDEQYRGGKNGFTDEAGKTNVGIFRMSVGDSERSLVVILLDSSNTESDTRRLQKEIEDNIVYQLQ